MSILRRRRGGIRRPRALLVTLLVLPALALPGQLTAAATRDGAAASERTAQAQRGVTDRARAQSTTRPRGARARIRPTARAPRLTDVQLRRLERGNLRAASLLPPRFRTYRGQLPRAANGPTTAADRPSNAPTTFSYFESRLVPFAAGSIRAPVGETTVDGSGRKRFVVGNWFGSRSVNGGATWAFVNPFADYGFGHTAFCCDQVVAYDAGRDRFFWLRQYNNGHLELSNSSDLVNWCTYDLPRTTFGLPAGSTFDYNRIGLTTDFVYVSTNVYPAGASFVFRIGIDQMITCGGIGISWFGPRATEFGASFVNGAGDTMYYGSNWVSGGLTNGTGFRVFEWPDDSNTITWYDRAITAYSFLSVGQGTCASANGLVNNWCQRTDSRLNGNGVISLPSLESGAALSPPDEAILSWAFNARQDASHPRPYIRRVYFRVRDIAYLGRSEVWNSSHAHLYPEMAVNVRGHVAMVWAWGGGTGTNAFYPGWGVTLDDDVTPTQPWTTSYTVFGAGNACINPSDNRRRWGDYLGIETFGPERLSFIAVGFRMNGATAVNCVTTANNARVEVRQVIFGRDRDRAAYNRWWNK